MVELVLQGKPDKRASDLPGAYQPFDWGLYHYLRAQYAVRTKAELVKVAIHDPKRVADERLERARAEEAYRRADVERFVDKKLHEVSELEMRDRMLGKRQRARSLFLDMAGSGLPASSGAKS